MSRKPLTTVAILAPFIFSFAFALDIYLPSIPSIRDVFATNAFVVHLTVSLFLLITGIGQLLVGPLSDNFGRRKIVLLSVIIFTIGSFLCALAPNIYFLLFARVIQALGACGMMVVSFAIVRDLHSGDDCARIYSFLNSTISLSPLLAPIIGGRLEVWAGWRASFMFLGGLGLLIILLGQLKITETLPTHKRIKLSKQVFSNYLSLLKNRKYFVYVFCVSAAFACCLTFFSVSSYTLITLLGVPTEHFGFYFAAIGIFFFFGSLISAYACTQIGTYRTVLMGSIFIALSGFIMLLWYIEFGLSIAGFIAPMMIMGIGGAMVMGGGAGGAIEPFPEMAGAAAALLGATEFVVAFAVSTFVLQWEVVSTIPLAFTLIIAGMLSLTLCWCAYHKHFKIEKIKIA